MCDLFAIAVSCLIMLKVWLSCLSEHNFVNIVDIKTIILTLAQGNQCVKFCVVVVSIF